MLRSISETKGYILQAIDGEIGRCQDFLFDDRNGAIRYMVAKTAKWLPGRKVVISPFFIDDADQDGSHLPLRLTRKQVEDSPPLDEHAPVSRQYEELFHEYYALPFYWAGPGPWAVHPGLGEIPKPVTDQDELDIDASSELNTDELEEHLRSCGEISGYGVAASDGEIGHVTDFLADTDWVLRYLVIDTRNWLPAHKVVVPMNNLESVQWAGQKLCLDLTKDEISNSTEYDPEQLASDDQVV